MDEVVLKVQKRAVASRGRARLNKSMLAALDAREESKLEIVNQAMNRSVTVTLFADSLVEEGYIRLSEEDLEALGLKEEDTVVIRKKPPLPEKIKGKAEEAAEIVSEGIGKAGEAARREVSRAKAETVEAAGTVRGEIVKAYGKVVEEVTPYTEKVEGTAREAYSRIREEVTPVAGKVEGATRETVAKIREEVTPYTEKVEGTAREAYSRIAEEIPPLKERLSATVEAVMTKLRPGEEAKLKKALESSAGSIRTASIADSLHDKQLMEIDLPPETVIAAIQRDKEIIIPDRNTRLVKGDTVYVIGKEESLKKLINRLEG